MSAFHFSCFCASGLVLNEDGSFFIIAFAEYVDSQGDFSQTFSSWLKVNFIVISKREAGLTLR